MSSNSAYTPLLHNDSEALDEESAMGERKGIAELQPVARTRPPALLYWACAASLICAAINISFLVLKVVVPRYTAASSPAGLEYASSYVGLEAVHRDSTAPPLRPIISFPMAIGQANRSNPSAVSLDMHRWTSTFGTVYPEDRRVLASPAETTFLQFWAGDFGMERCSLRLMIPAPHGADVSLSNDATVELWLVKAPRSLELRSLSWKQRPARERLLASWMPSYNSTRETDEFVCRSGTFQTFELACIGERCLVDFRQTPKHKDSGLWMVQRQSI
ncbi:hypothetical protein C8T65DRAFT_147348 [Cerioporus squamosus]|nr:hypothetical protein C8T65DRAFT_147348 [Cerioporus squamosus]